MLPSEKEGFTSITFAELEEAKANKVVMLYNEIAKL